MSCSLCKINPTFHSFEHFGSIHGHLLYYTAPKRATGVEEDGAGKLASFKQHLDSVKGASWIWVVDCREMPNSSITFVTGLFKILKRDHTQTLKEIWVLFPTTWTNMIIQLFKKLNSAAGIFHKVTVFDGHNLEIYHDLEKRGLSGEPFLWLTKTFIA